MYDKCIELNPDFYKAYDARGRAKEKMNDNTGAINDFTLSLKIPREELFKQEAYHNRGLIYKKIGKRLKGESDLKIAADLVSGL